MPTSAKNPNTNVILEWMHQVITVILCSTDLDVADTVVTSGVDAFLTDVAWGMCYPYHTLLTPLQVQ